MKQIVIVGGGSIGTCTAYYLCTQHTDAHVTLVDAEADADGGAFTPPAASGRAGGFLARDWCGGATDALARLSYALHRELAEAMAARGEGVGYRALDTLSVELAAAGGSGLPRC